MYTRLRRIGSISIVIVAFFASLLLPVSAYAVESEGVGAVPANPDPKNTRSNSIFVYTADPGKVIHDALKVANNTQSTKTISLYSVDSQNSSDGAFACAQAVDAKKSVGNWIHLSAPTVTVAPFQTKVVPFTVNVPSKVDSGEHNGCIAIQPQVPKVQSQKGVVLTFRSAIRVAVTVPGDLQAKLSLLSVTQKDDKDKILTTPSYKNEGNVSLDTTAGIAFKTVFGQTASAANGQFPILSNSTANFNFELKRPFWGGFYKRETTTSYLKLSDQGTGATPSSLATESKWVFITPQPMALLIELLILLAIVATGAGYWYKRKNIQQLHRKTKEYTVKKGDNIQDLAKTHHLSWKLLAKINKLKPPYSLKAGDTLKIPSKAKVTKKR